MREAVSLLTYIKQSCLCFKTPTLARHNLDLFTLYWIVTRISTYHPLLRLMRSFRLRNQRSLRYRFAVLYFTSVWCQWYIPVGFLQFIKLNMFTLSLFGIAVRFSVVYINGFTFLIFSIFKLPSYELHKATYPFNNVILSSYWIVWPYFHIHSLG
jgi:hypothetical protein